MRAVGYSSISQGSSECGAQTAGEPGLQTTSERTLEEIGGEVERRSTWWGIMEMKYLARGGGNECSVLEWLCSFSPLIFSPSWTIY